MVSSYYTDVVYSVKVIDWPPFFSLEKKKKKHDINKDKATMSTVKKQQQNNTEPIFWTVKIHIQTR